jgi:hypothetical protein
MPRLTYEQKFETRSTIKNPDLREFLEKAEQVRRSLPASWDRDSGMVVEMSVLLDGGKTLKGASSATLLKVAEFARKQAPKHANTDYLLRVAREIVSYHHSRMRD